MSLCGPWCGPQSGAVNIDLAISSGSGNGPACLVAVGAQVSHAAVEGRTGRKLGNRGDGSQGEVGLGVGGMDLLAGTAILSGGVRIAINNLIWGKAGSEHGR